MTGMTWLETTRLLGLDLLALLLLGLVAGNWLKSAVDHIAQASARPRR
jgi:hypothetical protein